MNRLILFFTATLVMLSNIFAQASGKKSSKGRCFPGNYIKQRISRLTVCLFTMILLATSSGILAPTCGQWQRHYIDQKLNKPVTVYIADIDGDNTLDIVATGTENDEVVWYKNNHPNWIIQV